MSELQRAHRLLCAKLVDEELYRRSLGGGRSDLSTVARYLGLPLLQRPALSLYFDPRWYLARSPEAAASGDDPLLHFLETGIRELRSPHPLIDLAFIADRDASVLGTPPDAAALVELLDYDLAAPGPWFDPEFYRTQLGGHAPQHGMLRHFLTEGSQASLRPNRWLDPAWYAERNADAPADPYRALMHFVLVGDVQGREPGPEFDGKQYLARYPDVAESGTPPLWHFLARGRAEGRQATRDAAPMPAAAVSLAAALPGRLPGDAASVLAADLQMRAMVAAMRQRRKDGAVLRPPSLWRSDDPAADLAALSFAVAAAPRVSILVPVHNAARITVECLMALAGSPPDTAHEVLVADDASSDPALAALGGVAGLVVLRQEENAGFLASCNAGFARCRGDYVLLLNNDTQVLPGAIDRMVAALDADPGLAAVGPKLIYPDGRLQEAGCFLRPNGESGMVGLFAGPDEPGYCHDRDVHYCSGAALMVRRSMVDGALFDPAYRPAYCEDADLCLRFLAAGHRVRYLHAAVVVHHLSVSMNDPASGRSETRRVRAIACNQQLLTERWGERLQAMDRVRTIAFYLPQFHPTRENDLWWGAGFSEWTNVARARPSYAGHYQPHLPADLGFYDLRQADTLDRQARLAARYGIEGFCVYHYNFGGHRMLDRPLQVVRENPDIPFRWCLCWANENWTRNWDGGAREVLLEQLYDRATLDSVIADAVRDAADPRYLAVEGRPIFLVYRPLQLPDPAGFAALCRAAFAVCRRASGLCRKHGGGGPRSAPGRSRLRRQRGVSAAWPRGGVRRPRRRW